MVVRLLQPLNAHVPIVFTELGMDIDVNFVQSINASLPIDSIVLGILTDVILELSKAFSPIAITLYVIAPYVTDDGIETLIAIKEKAPFLTKYIDSCINELKTYYNKV